MKIQNVYTSGGECLGDEYVDLSGLQKDTKLAIIQMIYLDERLDIMDKSLIQFKASDLIAEGEE